MCVECREEVDPHKVSVLVNLCGEDVCCEVVPVEEPLTPEHIQHVEHRWTIFQLLGGRGEASGSRQRHCRGSSPFEGVRGSGKLIEVEQHKGMVVVRKKEAMKKKSLINSTRNLLGQEVFKCFFWIIFAQQAKIFTLTLFSKFSEQENP